MSRCSMPSSYFEMAKCKYALVLESHLWIEECDFDSSIMLFQLDEIILQWSIEIDLGVHSI